MTATTITHTITRRAATVAIVTALTAAAAVLGSPAAHAASSTTCNGTSGITYSPGLTTTAQTVTYTETDTYSSCTSTDSTLTSGSFTVTVTIPDSTCTDFVGDIQNTPYTFTWNNGHSTNVNLSFTDVLVAGVEQVTGTGTVTSGEFTGATVVIVWAYLPPNPLACLTTRGVTSQTGTDTAEIIGL